MSIRATRRRAAVIAAIAGALSGAAARPARAQTPPAAADPQSARIAEAREAFRVGSALAKRAQWVDALAAFERSARLRPHAVTTYNIGFCERALGRFTRARKSLSRALAAPSHGLPAELAAEARGYLAEIDRRLSRAAIKLTKAGARVSVDGRPLEAAGGTRARPELVAGTREAGPAEPVSADVFDLLLDPGTHVVVVSAPGALDAVVTREFAPGATISLTLSPVIAPKAARLVVWSPARRAGVITSFSLAGAAAVVGGVLGGLALKGRSDLDQQCMLRNQCPAAAQGTIDRMKTFATLSTLSIAGAVGAATVGVVLIATGGEASAGSKAHGATATPWIGLGSVGISGSF